MAVQVIKRDILFRPAGKARTLHICLPEGYDTDPETRYPVMYFFDGHNLFSDADATYGTCWGLKDFLEGWEKPMIVVGLECGHEGDERLVEYCPYHINNSFFGDLNGIGKETLRWMAEELKPLIDREYRTYSFREATGIAGSSMGGLMSVYGIIAHNDTFSKAACLSSSISSCMGELLGDLDRAEIDPDTRIRLSWGSREGFSARDQHRMADALTKKGALVELYCQRGGRHCEAHWAKQVPDFMEFLWNG